MRAALLLFLLALPLSAVVYVPPDDAKVLLKRDLLPLDTDTMRELSAHLTDLAGRDIGADPIHWRATAQLLTIATRLDPANRPARDLGHRLVKGEVRPPPEGFDFVPPLSAAWQIVAWLLQPEADDEGHLLGHLLLDALHVVDPRHPLAKRHDPNGEAARWNGIVADLARFEGLVPPPPPTSSTIPDPDPIPPPPPVPRPPVKLRHASLSAPLFLYDDQHKLQLRIAPISMEVIASEETGPFSFTLSPPVSLPLLDVARDRVRRSLERTWPDLPLLQSALLDTGGQRYASRNTTAISGPASLLMHAALDGRALRKDLVLLADLKEDGSLTRPLWSWDYMRALRVAEGGCLLVPPDLQADLRAMLALESPEFFQKWEVLVVGSLDAALSLGAAEGTPDGLAEASRLFAAFQQLSAGSPVAPLCVNDKVRTRLEEILAVAPFHFSASMLLLQGNLERPTRVEREVAARIIRSGIEPLLYLGNAPLAKLTPARIDSAVDAVRADLTPFANYFRPEDQDLAKAAMDLTARAELLGRNLRGASGPKTGVPVTTLQAQLHDGLTAYRRDLAPLTGESLPPAPAPVPVPDQKTP